MFYLCCPLVEDPVLELLHGLLVHVLPILLLLLVLVAVAAVVAPGHSGVWSGPIVPVIAQILTGVGQRGGAGGRGVGSLSMMD